MSDAELVERALAGSAPAFEELLRGHARRVRALCLSRLPHGAPVDDMVQETFLRAYRLLATLHDRDRFGSFAAGIAVRVCADWRKARARTEVPLDDLAEPPAPPIVDGENTAHSPLRAAIAALPAIHRDAIALFYFARLPYREIAKTLGIGEAAVNARLTKARALLRERLGGFER